jgi:UDP-N-acetylmuramate: L-alanyl-gamma-D-glutamyl-meso-diaminopimelate ligase
MSYVYLIEIQYSMKIHLIAIGGAVMHNLALALKQNENIVTGSDDEIYEPARSRLKAAGLLPDRDGWSTDRITPDLDIVILGMHARKDNPELAKAQELGLNIQSFPEFIYNHAKDKKRVVVAGSHGKTTTTSMIMHVLRHAGRDFDYLVGALLEGFKTMVRLSDAPIMVIEGDEYLSSALDPVPKFLHYKPQVSIITGVAWDHMNVFPTYENYVEQFEKFIKTLVPPTPEGSQVLPPTPEGSQVLPPIPEGSQPITDDESPITNNEEGVLFYYEKDKDLAKIAQVEGLKSIGYDAFDAEIKRGKTFLNTVEVRNPDSIGKGCKQVPLEIFGEHNLANLKAAYLACKELGITDDEFFAAIPTFKGAAKRLQTLAQGRTSVAYQDFAHAPSKVKATIHAVKGQYPKRHLVACLELHTFSSLSKAFLPQYRSTMNLADEAIVFFNEHTLEMKKLPPLKMGEIKACFGHPNLRVFTTQERLKEHLQDQEFKNQNVLFMSSGTFMGLDLKEFASDLLGVVEVES